MISIIFIIPMKYFLLPLWTLFQYWLIHCQMQVTQIAINKAVNIADWHLLYPESHNKYISDYPGRSYQARWRLAVICSISHVNWMYNRFHYIHMQVTQLDINKSMYIEQLHLLYPGYSTCKWLNRVFNSRICSLISREYNILNIDINAMKYYYCKLLVF